jgi:hypothetical protein
LASFNRATAPHFNDEMWKVFGLVRCFRKARRADFAHLTIQAPTENKQNQQLNIVRNNIVRNESMSNNKIKARKELEAIIDIVKTIQKRYYDTEFYAELEPVLIALENFREYF